MLLARLGYRRHRGNRAGSSSRATRSPPTRSPAAASCSWPTGACWTQVHRRAARRPIRQVVFRVGGAELTIRKTVKPRDGVDHLVAPRRYVLDDHPRRTPRSTAGATITRPVLTAIGVHPCRRRPVCRGYGREAPTARPCDLPAKFVVGADGVRSRIGRDRRIGRIRRVASGRQRRLLRLRRGCGLARLRVPRRRVRRRPHRPRRCLPHPRRRGMRVGLFPGRRWSP